MFSPFKRRETWVFQKITVAPGKKPVYRRMGFNFVSYDGDPERYLEPRNVSEQVDTVGGKHEVIDPIEKNGAVIDFEFMEGHQPLHSFNDFNLATQTEW